VVLDAAAMGDRGRSTGQALAGLGRELFEETAFQRGRHGA